jgi:hypothetical protein
VTKALALAVVTLSLHVALITVVLQFRVDKRHPIFFLLLATSFLSSLAQLALRVARERELFIRLVERSDAMWYGLAGLALAWALWNWNDAASRIVARGLVMMIVMALVARYGARLPLVGCLGPRAASALNLAYLAPTVYLICALSNVGVDLLKILDRAGSYGRLGDLRMTTEHAASVLNSALRILNS